jgi:DNA-binding GntR family transcriptional regulator
MGLSPVGAPLRRRRLVDGAAAAIRGAILSGRLRTGARLRQTDLADRLRISRTPVREALGRLQQEGLIALLPGGGVQVVQLDLDAAIELYDLREVLDGLAARLAAGRAAAAALARIAKPLDRMARCLEGGDANQWFGAHVRFHEEIFRAAGNARLLGLSAVVGLSVRHFHPLLLGTAGRLEAAYREHRGILDAIARRDPEAAERQARAHIANARAIVLRVMADGAGSERDAAVQA